MRISNAQNMAESDFWEKIFSGRKYRKSPFLQIFIGQTAISGIFPVFSAGKKFFSKIGLSHVLGIGNTRLCAKNQKQAILLWTYLVIRRTLNIQLKTILDWNLKRNEIDDVLIKNIKFGPISKQTIFLATQKSNLSKNILLKCDFISKKSYLL